jgi:polar amino acid transport system substrate-binding protein
VVELLRKAFIPTGRDIDYETVPWSRALVEVREGRADAVIGATVTDARENNLRIGAEPVGIDSDCVFVPAANRMRVTSQRDLNGLKRVGIVTGYSYAGFVGEWISSPQRSAKLETTGGDRPAEVNLRNLASGQLDAVLENRSVGKYLIGKLKLEQSVRLAGCVGSEPIYVGFSGSHPEAATLARQLDTTIISLRRDGRLTQLLDKYRLKDWR